MEARGRGGKSLCMFKRVVGGVSENRGRGREKIASEQIRKGKRALQEGERVRG